MKQTKAWEFSIDNASILFLSLIRPYYTNSFRFSAKLHTPIRPDILQQAVNRIHPRFPSVIAGLRQDFLAYRQVAAAQPPVVRQDSGLLKPMTPAELNTCAFRVYYHDCTISIEVFHALTDGAGAIAVFTALLTEYLAILQMTAAPLEAETVVPEWQVEDSYRNLANVPPRHLPSRFSYLLPRPENADWQVRTSALTVETKKLLDAAHRYGVTLNTLLTTLLAQTVMELQQSDPNVRRMKPVRIMVPVDIRKLANSRTLRNCSLYTLPTMEVSQQALSTQELCRVFADQLQTQLSPENLSGMASYNVRTQNAWYFKGLPWKLKAACLRLGYRFFGESNSSLTLTNLGRIKLPEELQGYVADFQCYMTPRVTSPYGCTILSYEENLTLNMSRFCPEDQLGQLYFQKIQTILAE